MGKGMTMAEKVLSRASERERVSPGEYVTAKIDMVVANDMSFYDATEMMEKSGYQAVWDPKRIVVVIDHRIPAPDVKFATHHKIIRERVKRYGIKHLYDAGVGICNQLMPEKGHALPGRLIVGGDSHTGTSGAVGAPSCGIGATELFYVMVKGTLWFQVPETIRFILKGNLPRGVSSKDILLCIAGQYKAEAATYKSIEFTGPVARRLSIGQRMTISNMGVELGAKFTLFEADDKTIAYLKGRTAEPLQPFGSDPDAQYLAQHEIDISSLEPQVACPHNIDNVKPISSVGEVPVHQAFIGSCTSARTEDLEKAAAILKGRKVHPDTRLLIIPASREVYMDILKSGALQVFMEAGAILAPSGCGPCGGLHMGVIAPGETAISSTNRNFKGRMGSPESFVYLGSAETVAASAIEGRITDPRKYLS